jgi:thymidylate synthase
MITLFADSTANNAWMKASEAFRCGEQFRRFESRGGETSELLHATFSIDDPRQRWVVSRSPALNPAFALAEVVWIIKGREDERFLTYWNRQISKYAGKGPVFYGAYGHRLRRNFGLDQVERACSALAGDPSTRQIVLQIWDPTKDLPLENGSARADDIPCNVCALIKLREGRLEWLQVMRSNDLFLGLPHNFVQFTYLQEVLAGWLGVEVGTYNHVSDSLHVYDRDYNSMHSSAFVEAETNNDDLSFPKRISETCFDELERRIELFVSEGMTDLQHRRIAVWTDAPVPFQNILGVMAAEAARRRGWPELAVEIMSSNRNRAFVQIWNRWLDRMSKGDVPHS